MVDGSSSPTSAGRNLAVCAIPEESPVVHPQPHHGTRKDSDSIRVCVRCRPLMQNEENDIAKVLDRNMVVIQDPGSEFQGDYLRVNKSREKRYVFDYAFGADVPTEEVYRCTAQELIPSILTGYNATVFAYGATGAGKTHTMIGNPSSPGIMMRTLNELFEKKTASTSVKCSFIEVYNENIRDLLYLSKEYLDLREDPVKGTYISGVHEDPVQSPNELLELLHVGNQNRTTEGTAANETSSRSHAVLQITCEEKLGDGQTSVGKLSLIDLAGSERASRTENTGARLIEASNINRSLLALGNCINALVERRRSSAFIPYRDSKLTRLLKDSLGGNCRTFMIACISPSNLHYEETINTLKYANRTKNIKTTNYRRNVINSSQEADGQVAEYSQIITDLRSEIAQLKANLNQERHSIAQKRRQEAESESEKWKAEMIQVLEERTQLQRELMETETAQSHLLVELEKQQGKNQQSGNQKAEANQQGGNQQDDGENQSWARSQIEEQERRRSELNRLLKENRTASQNLQARLRDIADLDLRAFLELLYRAQVLEVERMELDHVYSMKRQILDQKDSELHNLRKQLELRNEFLGRQQSYLTVEEQQLLPGHVSLLESTITSPSQWDRRSSDTKRFEDRAQSNHPHNGIVVASAQSLEVPTPNAKKTEDDDNDAEIGSDAKAVNSWTERRRTCGTADVTERRHSKSPVDELDNTLLGSTLADQDPAQSSSANADAPLSASKEDSSAANESFNAYENPSDSLVTSDFHRGNTVARGVSSDSVQEDGICIDWSAIEVPKAHKIKGVVHELAGMNMFTESSPTVGSSSIVDRSIVDRSLVASSAVNPKRGTSAQRGTFLQSILTNSLSSSSSNLEPGSSANVAGIGRAASSASVLIGSSNATGSNNGQNYSSIVTSGVQQTAAGDDTGHAISTALSSHIKAQGNTSLVSYGSPNILAASDPTGESGSYGVGERNASASTLQPPPHPAARIYGPQSGSHSVPHPMMPSGSTAAVSSTLQSYSNIGMGKLGIRRPNLPGPLGVQNPSVILPGNARPDTGPVHLQPRPDTGPVHQRNVYSGSQSRKGRPKTDYHHAQEIRYAQRHQQQQWRHLQRIKEHQFHDDKLNPPVKKGGIAFPKSQAAKGRSSNVGIAAGGGLHVAGNSAATAMPSNMNSRSSVGGGGQSINRHVSPTRNNIRMAGKLIVANNQAMRR